MILVPVVVLAAWLFLRWRRAPEVRVSEVGPVGWVDGTNWRALPGLARVESRRLLRHPAFLITGVVLTPVMLLAASTDTETEGWHGISPSIALGLVPLGWAAIIAADLTVLRPRRMGADELMSACPAPGPVRASAVLLAAVPAGLVAALLAAAWVVFLAVTRDPSGTLVALDVAAGPMLVAGGVVLGVAVARLLPRPVYGALAAVAVAFVQARFFELAAWPWYRSEADPIRFLAFLADTTSVAVPALEVRPVGWHLVYLAGLTMVAAGVALARDGVPRQLAGALAAALIVVAVTGWAQVRPISDDAVSAMRSYLVEPEVHQTCHSSQATTYCVYPVNDDRVDDWAARVEAVRALLPEPVAGRPLEVRDRVPTVVGNSNCSPRPLLESVHPAVAKVVTPEEIWGMGTAVHPGTDAFPCGGRGVDGLFTALQVGSWAVGLPPSPWALDQRCTASGQARSVVALWLGIAATPGADRDVADIVDEFAPGLATFNDWTDPPMLGVRFATSDMAVALQLAEQPVRDVRELLSARWDDLVDPATPSTELARLAGLGGRTVGGVSDPDLGSCP